MVLDWEAPIDDGGTPVTNYRIYRGTSIGNEPFLVQLGTVFNYTDANLTNNQTYYYRVSAVNVVGEGPLGSEAWATPSPTIYPPTEPQNPVATPGLQSILLEWNPPMSNGGAPVTNYIIYRNGTFLVTIGNVLTYNDTGLAHGQTCSYTVAAVNDVGEGNQSAQVNCTTFDIPDAPENATAQPRSEKVILEWQCPVDYGRTDITEYLIYRGIVSGSLSFLASAGTNLTYTDTNLTDYQTYYYTVSAVNMIGEGPQCGELSATPVPPVHNIDVGTHFYTITDAIADVSTTNGHTITVDAGVYTESGINVNKTLNIIGEGRDVTTIDGFFDGRTIEISADWVNFTGFKVINSGFDSIPAILLYYANHSTIEANNISSNDFGVTVYESNYNTIANNTFMDNNLAVRTWYSINNTFTNNTINNSGGFSTQYDSENNTFTGNTISNSSGGFYFYDASNNSVINNTLSGNADGVYISWLCANITVYHNNFLNNTDQAIDLPGVNHWDNGYPDGGNFWSNYSGTDDNSGPGQNVSGSDGIGDTPFIIANGNQDSYPLMAPRP
jgi:parallel beta-helix repeat protein